MHLATYLGLLEHTERLLADAFGQVSDGHQDEPDVKTLCKTFAGQAGRHVDALAPVVERYGEHRETEPDRLYASAFDGTRTGGAGLLRDLQDLYLLASFADITWTAVQQAAQGLRDHDLIETAGSCTADVTAQLSWLRTRMKDAAPQALIA